MAEQEQRSHRGPRRDRGQQGEPQEKQFDERVIHIDRVARVVSGGRRFRFRALVVVGDPKKNLIGIGVAKGVDVTAAVSKAADVAKKHFFTVPLEKDTLSHEVQAKVGGAVILIKPASAGSGLIAGGTVRTILEVAGIRNAVSKSLGSSNKINTAYATLDALRQLQLSKDWHTTKLKGQSPKGEVKAEKVAAPKKEAKAAPKKTEEKK